MGVFDRGPLGDIQSSTERRQFVGDVELVSVLPQFLDEMRIGGRSVRHRLRFFTNGDRGPHQGAWGVTDWFEQGLYLPLYSFSSNLGPVLDGFKLRELFVVPHAADRTFFYGINFEFSYNARHWDPSMYSSEIRTIIGWHLGKFDFIVNPIFDNSRKGFNNLDFAPAVRIAYNFSQTWAVAVEEYADYGPIKHFLSANQQSQQLFGVIDYKGEPFNVEAGLGFGLTPGSDRLVAKIMLSRDLYTPPHKAN